MIRSLLSLVTLSAMMLAAQSTTSDEPFTPETAISLSHDLMRDVRLGNVQRAIISDIQLEIVFMGLSRMAELSASSGSAAEAQSTAQLSDLRNKFTQTTKAKSAGRLPNDPAATAPLLPLAADVELAAQIGDLKSANEAVGRFRAAVFKVAEDQFQKRRDADRERLSGPARDYSDLRNEMRRALTAGDVQTAEALAPKVLQQIEAGILQRQFLGADIYNAYDALGRGAFQRGDYEGAARFLLEAASKTTGGPNLNISGTNLTLARWLLDKGYGNAVIQFLTTCKSFWKSPVVDQWIAEIRGGQKPSFLPNVRYPS